MLVEKNMKIGIRREDKSKWEVRTPLVPPHIKLLKEKYDIQTVVQPSSIRVFADKEFVEAGAVIQEDLSECEFVFGVKEMPEEFFQFQKSYVFFSHTIKGQDYNMPMLQQLIDLNCNLFDYECIVDEKDRRLIFFGRFAGIAGMIDTLWAYGEKLKLENILSPFSKIKKTYQYAPQRISKQPGRTTIGKCKKELIKIGSLISKQGIPDEIAPVVCGFAGYGHVSQGAQEILESFPIIEITPGQLFNLKNKGIYSKKHIYLVTFFEEDIVEPIDENQSFELQDYYDNPEKYRSKFSQYLPYLSMLVNCIFWTSAYPRLVTKSSLESLFAEDDNPKLKVIGDISCDLEGAIEMTDRITEPDNPAYVYNPENQKGSENLAGKGVLIISRDNLPCEIAVDSSLAFSHVLIKFVPQLVKAFRNNRLKKELLPAPFQKALIVYQGKLTEEYQYLKKNLLMQVEK